MPERVFIVFGPPGTGKTTALLEEMDLYIAGDTPPERIGFFSFSRRAVREAKDRALERFGVQEDNLPWFRTLHSVGYKLMGLKREDVIQRHHLQFFFQRIQLRYSGQLVESGAELVMAEQEGDRCLGLYHLARARKTTVELEWKRSQLPDTPWEMVRDVARLYDKFKDESGLRDFSDMLEHAAGSLPLDVVFLDEAQDCSPAQWAFIRRVAAEVPVVYIAGDDDQTIYSWSGADSTMLLTLKGERQVLPVSYRMPRKVKELGDSVIAPVRRRVQKTFQPRPDAEGSVRLLGWPGQVNLHDGGTWLLLARTQRQLARYRKLCEVQGVVYSLFDGSWSSSLPHVRAAVLYERLRKGLPLTRSELSKLRKFVQFPMPSEGDEYVWGHVFPEARRNVPWFDALLLAPRHMEYLRALRKSGEPLNKPGRVRISTVHGAKGAEADSVVVDPTLTRRVARGAMVDPESERRVQYVAVTRAKSAVYLLLSKSKSQWSFPSVVSTALTQTMR